MNQIYRIGYFGLIETLSWNLNVSNAHISKSRLAPEEGLPRTGQSTKDYLLLKLSWNWKISNENLSQTTKLYPRDICSYCY